MKSGNLSTGKSAGIGRQARLRIWWQQCRVGSSPISCSLRREIEPRGFGFRAVLCSVCYGLKALNNQSFQLFSSILFLMMHRLLPKITEYILKNLHIYLPVHLHQKSTVPSFLSQIYIPLFALWLDRLSNTLLPRHSYT